MCFPSLAPGPNLYLTALAPNLYFTTPILNLYLPAPALSLRSPVLRFTIKVCYSYSVCLYKLSVFLYVLTCLSIMWAISKLQLFEISSQEFLSIFFIWLSLIRFCSFLFRNSITVTLLVLLFWYYDKL